MIALNPNFASAVSGQNTTSTEPSPVILVSGSSGSSKSVAAMMASLRTMGATPVFVGNHAEHIAENGIDAAVQADIARADGIVVLGNNDDIDPAKYGAVKHEKTTVETDTARALYEEKLIAASLENNVPLFAICGGMQRLNVLKGGTLHQHVPELVGDDHHMQGDIPPFIPVQFVGLEKGTKLAEMGAGISGVYTPGPQAMPEGIIMENSFHHQAVDRVAAGFRVAARSEDGIVEAIEPAPGSQYANQFVVAVQWHPEFGASPLSAKLNENFLDAAKERALTVPKSKRTSEFEALGQSAISSAPQVMDAMLQHPNAAGRMPDWRSFIEARRQQAAVRGPGPG